MIFFGIPLSLENLFLFGPLKLNIAPPLSFLSIFFLVFLAKTLFLSSISRAMIFYFYALLISIIHCLTPALHSSSQSFFSNFVKQSMSLCLGIGVFFVIRGFFVTYGKQVFFFVVLGGLPSIFVASIQFLGFAFGSVSILELVDGIRLAICGVLFPERKFILQDYLGYQMSPQILVFIYY